MPSSTRTAEVDYLHEYALAAERFAGAIVGASPRASLPSCPGWTVADLVRHVGNVCSWAATVVETGAPAAGFDDEPRSQRPKRLAEWYLGKAEDLYRVLAATDPGQPCWSFGARPGTAQFWLRRQLHETLMHTVDLAQATGAPTYLPAELAADGIDEVFGVFLARMHQRGHRTDLVSPLVVRETDGHRSWTLLPGGVGVIPEQPTAGSAVDAAPGERRPVHDPEAPLGWPPMVQPLAEQCAQVEGPGGTTAEADVLAGPAALLLQVLWKRQPVDHRGLEISGDRGRVLRFLGSRLTA